MLVWNGVQDEVESPFVPRPIDSIFVDENVFSTKSTRVLFFFRRGRHDRNVRAHLRRELNGQVSQTTWARDRDRLSRSNTPVAEWRIGSDPGTEQWTSFGKIDGSRNPEDEAFVNDDEC